MPSRNALKIAALITFFVVLAAGSLTGNRTIRTARAFAEGPNAGHSGAPGELTCAVVGCHGGEPNSGIGEFSILGPSIYEPGKKYEVTVKHMTEDNSRKRWGFQLTALDEDNNRAGDLNDLSGLTQVLEGGPGGKRQYIEHGFLGTFPGQGRQASWTFQWVAPSEDIGPVIFYAAGNQANNDGNNTGDQIYTTKAFVFDGPPEIESVTVRGKKLFVMGRNFAEGALLFMDGSKVKKVSNNSDEPTSMLTAKKAGNSIEPGQTVNLQVINPDDTASNVFSFTKPIN